MVLALQNLRDKVMLAIWTLNHGSRFLAFPKSPPQYFWKNVPQKATEKPLKFINRSLGRPKIVNFCIEEQVNSEMILRMIEEEFQDFSDVEIDYDVVNKITRDDDKQMKEFINLDQEEIKKNLEDSMYSKMRV